MVRSADGEHEVVSGGSAAPWWTDDRADAERLPAASPSTASTTVPAPAPSPTSTTPTTRPEPTRRAPAPTEIPLVRTPATVSAPGIYVVRRDGSGLSRMASVCPAGDLFRQWLDDDEVLVNAPSEPGYRLRIDGAKSRLTMPTVTDRYGREAQLPARGSPSPDGRLAVTFGGTTTSFGVAFVHLARQEAKVVLWDDNPQTSWSTTGELVLLLGGAGVAVVDHSGKTIRDWASSPLSTSDQVSWSPDGRRVLGWSASDPNRTLVYEPLTGQSVMTPKVGQSFNPAVWAGSRKVVVAEAGIDHQVLPAIHVYDVATRTVRRLAEAAWSPTSPPDGQVVAFEDRADRREVDIVRIDGTGRTALARAPEGYGVWPYSWSPDGEWLMFDACPFGSGSGDGQLPTT